MKKKFDYYENEVKKLREKYDKLLKETEMSENQLNENRNNLLNMNNKIKRQKHNSDINRNESNKYQKGTEEILKYLSKRRIKIVVGGGDTAASINKLKLDGKFYHVSTGGGATLKYLEDEKLIGIEVISDEK